MLVYILDLFSCYLFFYGDIFDFFKKKKLFFKIIIASIPVMILGFLLVKTNLIVHLRNIKVIAWMTLIFGIFLFISDKFKLSKNIDENFKFKDAIIIGFFQVLSLIPGVSRSGITISAANT